MPSCTLRRIKNKIVKASKSKAKKTKRSRKRLERSVRSKPKSSSKKSSRVRTKVIHRTTTKYVPYSLGYRYPYDYRWPLRVEKHYHAAQAQAPQAPTQAAPQAAAPAPTAPPASERTDDIEEIKRRSQNVSGIILSDDEARAQIRGGVLERLRQALA
jgi:hypothetical protein